MFIFKFLKNILQSIGFFQKNGKIIFLGLDNAGKTTLLKRLKDNKIQQHDPTMFATSEGLRIGSIHIKAFDIGGHPAARKAWKNYFPNIDGIVYLVDAAHVERIPESKYELEQVIANPMLRNIPIAILGNKIDKKAALSEEEFKNQMGLDCLDIDKEGKGESIMGKPINTFMCSISNQQGYFEAFEWLGQFLK